MYRASPGLKPLALAVAARPHISESEDIREDLAGPTTSDSNTPREDFGDGVATCPLLGLVARAHLDDVSRPDFWEPQSRLNDACSMAGLLSASREFHDLRSFIAGRRLKKISMQEKDVAHSTTAGRAADHRQLQQHQASPRRNTYTQHRNYLDAPVLVGGWQTHLPNVHRMIANCFIPLCILHVFPGMAAWRQSPALFTAKGRVREVTIGTITRGRQSIHGETGPASLPADRDRGRGGRRRLSGALRPAA